MKIYQFINLCIISFGSIIGAYIRFLIIEKVKSKKLNKANRVLIVNLIASFIIGLFSPLLLENPSQNHEELILFLFGFIGSLSTFSSFILHIFNFSLKKRFRDILSLIFNSLFFGFISISLGFFISNF